MQPALCIPVPRVMGEGTRSWGKKEQQIFNLSLGFWLPADDRSVLNEKDVEDPGGSTVHMKVQNHFDSGLPAGDKAKTPCEAVHRGESIMFAPTKRESSLCC